VNLVDSKYGLSLIDVGQIWPGQTASILNVIASDFTPLEGLSPRMAEKEILDEVRRYLPFGQQDVSATAFQSHVEEPLFMNDVGAWEFRPDARTELPNLYLAGDYCRSQIDLLSMEGAVTTGLLAAEALRRSANVGDPIQIAEPQTYPRWLLLGLRFACTPLAALAKLCLIVSGYWNRVRAPAPTPPIMSIRGSRVRT